MRWTSLFFASLLFLSDRGPVPAQGGEAERPIVFKGARIHPVSGPPIEKGVLVIHKGKIVDVGPEDKVAIPEKAEVRDCTGKNIIPGLVDTHSHLGLWARPHVPANGDGNETSKSVTPGVRALDAIWTEDPGFRMAQAGGLTTANIMPGSANVIGGQTIYVKLRGKHIDDMRMKDLKVVGGLKMANGENPKRFNRAGQEPKTRMKIASMQREAFLNAKDYKAKWEELRKKADPKAVAPKRDADMDALVEVLERKRTVHFHSHRADDIMTAIRISEEFGFELVIQHGTEAYLIADELAKRKIPVSMTLIDSPGGKLETAGLIEENGAILQKAGVKVAVNTDDAITESRFFLRTGSIAMRGGMTEDQALRAQTLSPAEIMHVENRLGSLDKGKDADFVVLSGAPYSIYTMVLETYIDGIKVFDRSVQRDWSFQAGGFSLNDPKSLPRCPEPLKPFPESKVELKMPDGAPAATGKPEKLVVFAKRIHTIAHGLIEDGAILVEEGKIKYVGPRDKFNYPAKTPVLLASDVTPGLIDSHTSVPTTGLLNVPADQDMDETSGPNQADLRILDAFNPREPLLQYVREQGVTIIHAVPGRVNAIAGQSGLFRTYGTSAEQMSVRFPASLVINLGEQPKSRYPEKGPTSRMGTAKLLREAFFDAQSYVEKRKQEGKERPGINLKHEALGLALKKEIPTIFAAQRSDDILTALRLGKEFELKCWLDMCAEGYLVADAIAEAKVPVIMHPAMQVVGGMETFHSQMGNSAALADKKIPIVQGTGFESYVPKSRVVRWEAAMAAAYGLGRDRALRSITLDAAKLFRIDEKYGSLEVGKVADLVLYDGDPFENATHVTHTVMEGRIVYDRAEYLKLPFARRAIPLIGSSVGCCLGYGW